MSFPRFQGRVLCAAGLLALSSASLLAQTTTPALPAPDTTPMPPVISIPVATPAPSGSLPGIPAADPTKAPPVGIPVATKQSASTLTVLPPYAPDYPIYRDHQGSTYIPVDSPIYPMALRLYSLGYLDTAFISMRPWTRRSLLHALEQTHNDVVSGQNQQAMQILARLDDLLADETPDQGHDRGIIYGLDTAYARLMGITGQPLRDSYHLGATIVNDYGRPYDSGLNAIAGFSSVNEYGRFSLYVRGEYQHSPAGNGYSVALANQLSCLDEICPFGPPNDPQATIPFGRYVATQNPFRLQEAVLSFHFLGHEFSGGKSDAWTGPGMGAAMGYSNNAENIYSFRINRIEPLHIPLLSRFIGPLRYDFFVGSLKGHTAPNDPWVHSEMFSFRPTSNFEFAFQRTVIWGGKGHEPVTLHTFLRSFFSTQDTESNPSAKLSSSDPGARFSSFSFSWRLPFLTHSVTLYTDSEAHDDVSPVSAPRRAAYRPGLYLSHLPYLPKMDFRIEGASTDVSTLRSSGGQFQYYEVIQRQGYTNKGYLFGDWIGREAKGGQAWLTYHLSAGEWIQAEFLTKQTPKDFISGGVHQNDYKIDVVKHLHRDLELNAWVQFERWKAPVTASAVNAPLIVVGGPLYYPNAQHDTTIAAQLTWYPRLHTTPHLNGK